MIRYEYEEIANTIRYLSIAKYHLKQFMEEFIQYNYDENINTALNNLYCDMDIDMEYLKQLRNRLK